ncbi:transposase, partial [Streptomyces sp. NPDC055254]
MARHRCYPSDTYDDEWALIEPLLPIPACETPRGGRPEKHPRPEIVDAIRYVVDTGCKWRALPKDYPPWRTCYNAMARWAAKASSARWTTSGCGDAGHTLKECSSTGSSPSCP